MQVGMHTWRVQLHVKDGVVESGLMNIGQNRSQRAAEDGCKEEAVAREVKCCTLQCNGG